MDTFISPELYKVLEDAIMYLSAPHFPVYRWVILLLKKSQSACWFSSTWIAGQWHAESTTE